MRLPEAVAVTAPSIGPAIVTVLGQDIPVLSMALSALGLLLARYIAPPPARQLTRTQNWALTGLLLIVLFTIVTGDLSVCSFKALLVEANCAQTPLNPGMAVVWGVGLGLSGLLAVERYGDKVMKWLRGDKE